MVYTEDQYAIMEMLSDGIVISDLTQEEKEIVEYLESFGLVQPRIQIAEGYMELTQEGKRILSIRKQQIRNKEEFKNQQLQKAAADKRERKSEKCADRIFQILLVFLGGLITFIFGVVAEYSSGIVNFVKNLFH